MISFACLGKKETSSQILFFLNIAPPSSGRMN